MLNNLITYITQKSLFTPQDKILLAISGGVDSVVLAHLFTQIQPYCQQIALAHCNFQLRGNDSDNDERFVTQLAQQWNIPCFVTRFDTYTLAKVEKGSIQMIARDLRYRWFEEIRQREGYDYIATAHHQNDLVETVLLNLVRGTGIAGLHGIREKQGNIIRPLLSFTREVIEVYAQEKQLKWREDTSNKENKYYRNRLRNEVIPILKKLNPSFEKTLSQSVEKISAVERFFDAEVAQIEKKVLTESSGTFFLNLQLFNSISEKLIILFEILKKFGFSYIQTKEVLASLQSEPGKKFLSPTYTLVKDRVQLVIAPVAHISQPSQILIHSLAQGILHCHDSPPLQLERKVITKDFEIPRNAQAACLDWNKLILPLTIRPWQQGDWFKPLGMNQRKKLSDFLIDQKIPVNLKDQVYVIMSGQDIVWVVNYRVDNRYKVSPQTKEVLMILPRD